MPPRLVCFDIDGTLVDGFPSGSPYVWRVLHDGYGTPEEPLRLHREAFFAGKITYDQWFAHDLSWLAKAGATRAGLSEILRARLHLVRGVEEVVSTLHAAGSLVATLSGSVDLVLETLLADLPLDAVLVNRLHFDDHGRLVGGTPTPYDIERKADGLRALASRFDVSLAETAFVGDAVNDVAVARIAGVSIAFNCRDQLLASVSGHVFPAPAEDLRVILPALGIPVEQATGIARP
jgi:HAD superfamily phosphoserine phosphatase-like hydrolase